MIDPTGYIVTNVHVVENADEIVVGFSDGSEWRLGFPRAGSRVLLTRSLQRIPQTHRYAHWRKLAETLGLNLPDPEHFSPQQKSASGKIVIHTGAAQVVRIWPLERFQDLVVHLRQNQFMVQVACDFLQREWWLSHGESNVFTAENVTGLIRLLDTASVFIGNDSGPGHVAAICGVGLVIAAVFLPRGG